MALKTKRAEQRIAVGSRVMGVALAVMLATAGAWAGGGGSDQDRRPAPSRQPVPDNDSVPPTARRSYEDFWKRLPKAKADALEREVSRIEARQRRGEPIERDVEKLRRDYPQLAEMSTSLQPARWLVTTAGGGTQPATCTGLGGIRRNGTMWCLGRLTT
jgi:hypothetical protein